MYWKLIENLRTEFIKTQDMYNFTVELLAKGHVQFPNAPKDLEKEFKPVDEKVSFEVIVTEV